MDVGRRSRTAGPSSLSKDCCYSDYLAEGGHRTPMEPSRREPERSAGKIPINFLLAEDTDGVTRPEQQLQRHQASSYSSSSSRQYGGDRRSYSSQQSSPTSSIPPPPPPPHTYELNSPRPTIPGHASSPTSSWTNSTSTILPPIRINRTYSTESSTSSSAQTHRSSISHPQTSTTSSTTSSSSTSTSPSILIDRKPRAPRPSYSEEQKFFIMYARIIRDNTWPEIEDRFEKFFGSRSKGGLTSVYYRVRREWGLMEVLKSGPGSYAADCREVEARARNFSSEFLGQIGYLDLGQG